ncbi:MAG: NTP transferase domain-containing protein, partial [bacterium]|nr:NTP transferase domain-containing protein [Candidatus Colisoma equi]
MKAIIPAAGLGTRFLPLTRAVPKEMLPIGSNPALQVIIDEALVAGCDEVLVIISHAKELVRKYFAEDPQYADRIRWVYQEEQHGLGHAVLQAAEVFRREMEDGPVLILLGDAVISGCSAAKEMVSFSKANGGASVIGCEPVPPEKVSRYGILKGEGGRIVDLVEKPFVEEAPSDLAIAGRYLLDGKIFDFLKTQTPGKGGEIQLADAIRRMVGEAGVTL